MGREERNEHEEADWDTEWADQAGELLVDLDSPKHGGGEMFEDDVFPPDDSSVGNIDGVDGWRL